MGWDLGREKGVRMSVVGLETDCLGQRREANRSQALDMPVASATTMRLASAEQSVIGTGFVERLTCLPVSNPAADSALERDYRRCAFRQDRTHTDR